MLGPGTSDGQEEGPAAYPQAPPPLCGMLAGSIDDLQGRKACKHAQSARAPRSSLARSSHPPPPILCLSRGGAKPLRACFASFWVKRGISTMVDHVAAKWQHLDLRSDIHGSSILSSHGMRGSRTSTWGQQRKQQPDEHVVCIDLYGGESRSTNCTDCWTVQREELPGHSNFSHLFPCSPHFEVRPKLLSASLRVDDAGYFRASRDDPNLDGQMTMEPYQYWLMGQFWFSTAAVVDGDSHWHPVFKVERGATVFISRGRLLERWRQCGCFVALASNSAGRGLWIAPAHANWA